MGDFGNGGPPARRSSDLCLDSHIIKLSRNSAVEPLNLIAGRPAQHKQSHRQNVNPWETSIAQLPPIVETAVT